MTSNMWFAILLLGSFIIAIGMVDGRGAIYNVTDYGAVGDGRRDDTNAFLKAWQVVCADNNYPTFFIPSGTGKTFLLSKITFSGPCKSNIQFQINGNIVGLNTKWTTKVDTLITFININGLTVGGQGQIDGRGAIWWPCVVQKTCLAPYTLQFHGCDGLQLSGIYLKDSGGKHIAINKSNWVKIYGITATAPGESPNTDGILIYQSKHVDISSSTFATGDDCIAIGPGCYDVNVSRITCGPGHGISIGSLGSGSEVEKIRVSNCNISQTTNGVRIKTWQGGSGYAKDILFEHIIFNSVKVPIVIDQYYCPSGNCANQTSAVAVSGVTYYDLHGTSVKPVAINVACSQSMGCNNVVLNDVSFTVMGGSSVPTQSYCLNVNGKMVGKVSPQVSCLKY